MTAITYTMTSKVIHHIQEDEVHFIEDVDQVCFFINLSERPG